MKKYGLRGAGGIGGNVAGAELSDARFHPFWAKAEALGVLVFLHPQGDHAAHYDRASRATAMLANTIGCPLDTTIALSHLIFEGTLDRFPGVKIIAAHGGGFLPSYSGRSDLRRPAHASRNLCPACTHGPIKESTVYLKQMYYDTMVFNPRAAASRGRGGAAACCGHRLSVPVDEDRGGSDPVHAGAERRGQGGHPGRDGGGAAGIRVERDDVLCFAVDGASAPA